MIHFDTVSSFGSTFSPVHLVGLVAGLLVIVTLVAVALRNLFRWARRRVAGPATGPN